MNWPAVTFWLVAGVIAFAVAYDLAAYLLAGSDATVSSVLLAWAYRDPRRAFLAGLIVGLIVGHVWLYQEAP